MSRVRITGEGVITGDGISGLATRSDVARLRELKKYGLEMEWYDAKVVEQANTCADCHRQERSKLGNGKRRPLGLGFQNGQPNRLICTSCAGNARKEKSKADKQPKDYASFEEFWQANREALNKENPLELVRLRERHDAIIETYEAICDYVRGTDNCPEGLEPLLDEVEQELRDHGTTELNMLCIPFYQASRRAVYDQIVMAGEEPAAPTHAQNALVFAKYGLPQALPTIVGDKNYVRLFLKQNGRYAYPDWGKAPNPIQIQRCATYGCRSEYTWNLNDRSTYPPPQWFCPACKARNAHVVRKPAPRPADMLFTVNGIVQSPNDPWFGQLPGAK